MSLGDLLFGRPLATAEDEGERVGPLVGVAVLGLDALASAAYGPEALLTVLMPLGMSALDHIGILTLVIVGLLLILGVSYRQTIQAYPNGGGAYTVAKENLGPHAALFAAAALVLDYLLNVGVAVSAGIGALVSAVPALLPHTLALCLGVLVLITLVNLRGVRATGLAFMLPTYLFIGCLIAVIGIGVFQATVLGGHSAPADRQGVPEVGASASLWLLMRAFANGCTAMTGVEAVSNGVPIFREPSPVGARRALALIVLILAILLGGIAFVCRSHGVIATPPGQAGYESVLSQVATRTVGRGAFYYVTIASIVSVLTLSANTSFADFPRVCRLLAEDKFLPELFSHRGRRLTFSYGILFLFVLSGVLLITFRGITDRLIPLFAVGALSAFTMSQAGMVAHWRKRKGLHAKRSLFLNLVGAAATAVTLVIVLLSKFAEGAWISVFLVAGMVVLFRKVKSHYEFLARATANAGSLKMGPHRSPIAVIPIRRWDAVALKAVRFAVGITSDVVVVHVLGDREGDDLSARWHDLVVSPASQLGIRPPELLVRRSAYRRLFTPLLEVVVELEKTHPDRQIAVVVPELIEARWYHYVLHNHTASVIKALLLYRGGPQIVIVTMPWYLRDWMPERRWLVRNR